SYSVSLIGPSPWGFRLQGGKDFSMPLTISRLTDGGKAAKAKISVGDVVLSIDGIATDTMTHLEAQNKIKACTGNLSLTIQSNAYNKTARPFGASSNFRAISPSSTPTAPKASIPSASSAFTPAAPSQQPPPQSAQGPQPPFPLASSSTSRTVSSLNPSYKPSSAYSPFSHSSSSSSSSGSSSPARVTGPAPPSAPTVPPPSVYNTPINLYSNENACEVAMGQRRGLLDQQGGVEHQNGLYILSQSAGLDEKLSEALRFANACLCLIGVPRKPIAETELVVNHGSHLSDASKKRLIEDTEDWHPRTGTSQSRSFRILAQITGTENGQYQPRLISQEVKHAFFMYFLLSFHHSSSHFFVFHSVFPLSCCSLNSVFCFLFAEPAHESNSPGKKVKVRVILCTKVKIFAILSGDCEFKSYGNTTESLTVQNKPCFLNMSDAYASSLMYSWMDSHISQAVDISLRCLSVAGLPKAGVPAVHTGRVTGGAPKGLDRPAPQPHPKDQDSLVQRAEHIPAGTRTPMCGHCNMVIRGPFLVAMGKSWHPEEFNCAHCHSSLADVGFVEERGAVYCEHCYERFFAPCCCRCQQKILGEVINALKQTWHVYCFLCSSCQQPIRNNTFHLEDGQPYCERDYYNLFGTSCHGCDFPIEAGDKFLEALGFTWHDTCFVCSVCSTSLEGQAFFAKKDKPLCKKHAHTVKI
ncbi:PDZ and LIM domain 5 isoform X3, partial [Silurus meridionalis]